MIIDLTLTRSWNQHSEFVRKSHRGFRYPEGLSFCYLQAPWPNLKGSAEIRILANPWGTNLKETRIWDCFITDIVRILCKNIQRAWKGILCIPHRILSEKDAYLGRIVAIKSVEDPARKRKTFLTESLFSFWLWSWSMSSMNPDRIRYYSFGRGSWAVSEQSWKGSWLIWIKSWKQKL